MTTIDIDALTNAQLDRLQERLTARVNQREAEKAAAKRERDNPRQLRPGIGSADIVFNDLARRNWDQECLAALETQRVPFAVAPKASVVARDGTRLGPGQELRPAEHLDARKGDVRYQIEKLVASGHVLERRDLAPRELAVEEGAA